MAKYKVEGSYTGACDTGLQGAETPVMDDILKYTEDKLELMCTICTQEQYKSGLKFENTDLVAYINSDVTFTRERSTEELDLPHSPSTLQATGKLKFDSTDLSMVMTKDNLNKFKQAVTDDKTIAVAMFDKDNIDSETKLAPMLESYFGSLSKFGSTYTNGGVCTCSVTFTPSVGDLDCESPDYE